MKGLIITNKGIEDISALEVKELLNTKKGVEKEDFVVKFPIKKLEELALLCYKSQSVSKILYLLGEIKVTKNLETNIKNLKKLLENVKLERFLKNKVYRVDCERIGGHDFKSVDVSSKIAKFLINGGYKEASFKSPEVILFIFIAEDKGYVGIDFAGFDLSKRYYRIFNNPRSIKGNIAYALVREAGYNKNKVLVDPYCKSGEIIIEAALFASNFPVNYYRKDFAFSESIKFDFEKENKKIKKDKLKIYGYDPLQRNIIAAKKNSKIAGVIELINLGNFDLNYIKTKHGKESVDIIITRLPESSKHKSKEKIQQAYKEFFNQSKFILKKDSKIIVIGRDRELIRKEKGKFKIVKEYVIYTGGLALEITALEK